MWDRIDAYENALKRVQDENAYESIINILAVLIELLIRVRHSEQAWQYGGKLRELIDNEAGETFLAAWLSYARILISKKCYEEVLRLLGHLEQELIKRNKARDLASAYILYAEVHYLSRDYKKMDDYIDQAVKIAEPQEYYQVFLEDTVLMKDMIRQRKEWESPFLKRVVEYLGLQFFENRASEEKQSRSVGFLMDGDEQREKLSKREIDILSLIGKGMSNNEISNTLYISINTTQWHISHIYSKLGVKNRTQAVLKARELGIL